MGERRSQQIVYSMGCSKLGLSLPTTSIFGGGHKSTVPMSPATASADLHMQKSPGPFAGLIICVTGLSKGMFFSFKSPFIWLKVEREIFHT